MSIYLDAFRKLGFRGTMEHLFAFKRIKVGTLVGADKYGNKYFENLEYPYGQHRWVQHKEPESQQLAEASNVPPEWFLWLHYTANNPPASETRTSDTGVKIAEGEANPVKHHYNLEHTKDWRPNQTLVRERGYGLPTHYSKVGENKFYTQPGHPMNPNFVAKKSNVDTVFIGPNYETEMKEKYGENAEKVMQSDWRRFAEIRKQMNIAESTK